MARTISADSLYESIRSGSLPGILDIRNPDEFAAWRIETPPSVPHGNAALWHVLDEPARFAQESPDNVVVVCAHGGGSEMVADLFAETGREAVSLEGGMRAWASLLVPQPVPLDGPVRCWQLQRPAKGCLSYVVGVPGHECVVVDPPRFPDAYLRLAREHDMRITHVVDTHLHADHVSGGHLLAEQVGAEYHLPEEDAGTVPWPNRPLRDGEQLSLGPEVVEVVAVHLPGHTPGTTALLLRDRVLLAGDTVFVRGVGRPDLTGQAAELARMLYDSVHDRLRALDPATVVLPAHWSDPDEIGPDGIVSIALDEVFRSPLMNITELERFIAEIMATLPPAPEIYDKIRLINAGEPADADELELVEIGKNQCAASNAGAG